MKCKYDVGTYPKGRCPEVDECDDVDLPCYGSMCDSCIKTCKGGISGSRFSLGACSDYSKVNPE